MAEHNKGGDEASKSPVDARRPYKSTEKAEDDKKLDEMLKESFPASDPPSTAQATGREKPAGRIDRQPPDIITESADEARQRQAEQEKPLPNQRESDKA